jgi:hypothetical protein
MCFINHSEMMRNKFILKEELDKKIYKYKNPNKVGEIAKTPRL